MALFWFTFFLLFSSIPSVLFTGIRRLQFLLSKVENLLTTYFYFKLHLSQSRSSIEAYFDLKYYLPKSRTSLQAYIDFRFHLSNSGTSLQAHTVTVAKTIKKGVRKGYNIVLNNRIDSQY